MWIFHSSPRVQSVFYIRPILKQQIRIYFLNLRILLMPYMGKFEGLKFLQIAIDEAKSIFTAFISIGGDNFGELCIMKFSRSNIFPRMVYNNA